MIYEYALDPSLMIDVNSCRTIFDNFKPEQGKLIADVPQQWIREAYQAINKIPPDQCQPIMRKTLKNNLKILLKQSLCDSRKRIDWNRDEQSLLENMALQNNVYPFSAVITHEAQQDPVQTYSLQNLFITAPDCWNEPTQIHVKRNAKDIVDALAPLLSISTEMILIDRHIYPNEWESRNVLIELITRAQSFNFGNGINTLVIHSMDHRKDMQQSLERNILPHLPDGFEVVCYQWPKALEHDRFLVTDIGGIDLGEGFDEKKHGGTEEVRLALINSAMRKKLLSKFSGVPTHRSSIHK